MSFVRRWWTWMGCWLWAGWFPLHNDRDDAWQPCGLPQSVEPCVGNIAVPPDHNTTLQKSIHKSLRMGLHKILDMSCTPCMSHHVICHVHHASASCNIWRHTRLYFFIQQRMHSFQSRGYVYRSHYSIPFPLLLAIGGSWSAAVHTPSKLPICSRSGYLCDHGGQGITINKINGGWLFALATSWKTL